MDVPASLTIDSTNILGEEDGRFKRCRGILRTSGVRKGPWRDDGSRAALSTRLSFAPAQNTKDLPVTGVHIMAHETHNDPLLVLLFFLAAIVDPKLAPHSRRPRTLAKTRQYSNGSKRYCAASFFGCREVTTMSVVMWHGLKGNLWRFAITRGDEQPHWQPRSWALLYVVVFFFTFIQYISCMLSSLALQNCCHPQTESSPDPAFSIHSRKTTLHHTLRSTNGCVHPHVHPTHLFPAETSKRSCFANSQLKL
jgi:hypothetical protein